MESGNLWKIWRLNSWVGVLSTVKEMAFLLFILVKRRARIDGWMSHPEKKLCWYGSGWWFACSTEKLEGCCSLTSCVEFSVGLGTGYFQFVSVMDRDKGKLPFNEIICTSASQANKSVKLGNSNATTVAFSSVNDEQVTSQPKAITKLEKLKGKCVVDSKSLFEKLASARAKAKKTKELTLMACLIGKFLDFPKIFTKLRMDWRFIKGEMQFNDQKSGWFEIVFSNPLDLTKIWENRPYHIGGQLLLLKHWPLTFDPLTKPISYLDLWIKIFKLPNEYKNPEALSAILEANNFGSFIRLDPIHLKRKWVKFVRLCVNTDVEVTTGQKIIIPDEEMIEQKYNVWFDDFPVGCGNCGDIDHVFNNCPDKTPAPPSITITLKKPSSKASFSGDNEGWTTVGHEKGQSNKYLINPHGHKPYLAENASIDVIYESDGSSDQEKVLNDEKERVTDVDPKDGEGDQGVIPGHLIGLEGENLDYPIYDSNVTPGFDVGLAVENVEALASDINVVPGLDPVEVNPVITETNLAPPPSDDALVGGQFVPPPALVMPQPVTPEFIFEEAKMENNVPLFEDEDEDPSEDEEDDPEEMLFGNEYFINEDPVFVDSIINTQITFTAEDLEEYLNEPDEEMLGANESGHSFYSTHQSILSSSSMVNKLDGLDMNMAQGSKSNSSKRKTNDGDEDTASSNLMGSKKPRI